METPDDDFTIAPWDPEFVSSQVWSELTTPGASEEQLCYGMVCVSMRPSASIDHDQIFRASVKLCGEMAVLESKLKSDSSCPIPGHYQMCLKKREERYAIVFPDETTLGEVNAQLETALKALFEQHYQLGFEVFAPIQPIRETISRATKQKEAIVRVNINLYGPQTSSKDVGDELSKYKIYLQRPDYIKAGLEYDNPHVLKLAGFQLSFNHQLEELRENGQDKNDLQKADDFKETISTIYSSLTRNSKLVSLEDDGRLKTKLLK